MRRIPKPNWDVVAGWFDGSDARTTRRISWGAVALLAVALAWSLQSSGGEGQVTPNIPSSAVPASAPADGIRAEPACPQKTSPQDPRPPDLAKVSTGWVEPGRTVESTRWGRAGPAGLWGVAAVAHCDMNRLDAVWITPSGQKRRHQISGSGESAIGVVANGHNGAISVYSVVVDQAGQLSARLHISTDWGMTWEVREVPRSAERDVRSGVLPTEWRQWRALTD